MSVPTELELNDPTRGQQMSIVLYLLLWYLPISILITTTFFLIKLFFRNRFIEYLNRHRFIKDIVLFVFKINTWAVSFFGIWMIILTILNLSLLYLILFLTCLLFSCINFILCDYLGITF